MLIRPAIRCGTLFLLGLLFSFQAFAQDPVEGDSVLTDAPRVFIDCNFCDLEYMRQQLTWVNYVRDRKLADVHVLATQQNTGSGGREFQFTFIGQERFTGMIDTLLWSADVMATSDERREGRTRMLKLGLLRFAAQTDIMDNFSVAFSQPVAPTAVEDKWNNWVFSVNVGGWFNGEESYQSLDSWGSVNADRVTPDWKIELSAGGSYNENKFDVGDEIITNVQRRQYFNSRVVRSIDDHWSVGGFVNARSSIFDNYQLFVAAYPGIEYNLYPYSESSRRQMRTTLNVGFEQRMYNDTTIFNVIDEQLYGTELGVAYKVQEKWGSVSASLTGSAYLHDFSKNSLRLWSSFNLRVVKGLSFRVSGNVALIRNQLNLVKGGASEEEILLRQRQIATGYRYWGNVGITYTFGSIYNSVVNPRFGG